MKRIALLLMLCALPAQAEQALVAVAANFLKPAEVLANAYFEDSGHQISLAGGATGQHYAQIIHGAPYDIFLAADEERPALLEDSGFAEIRFTYALGRLALYSADAEFPVAAGMGALTDANFVAMANPLLAPYGRAAIEALEASDLLDLLQPKLVQGQNVGQAFGMVASGNAKAGLVALSMAQAADGVFFVVPDELHSPIRQDAVLLNQGKGNLAAEGFLAYLATDAARALIEEFGYDVVEP